MRSWCFSFILFLVMSLKFEKTTMGTAHYAPELNALVWKIKAFQGGRDFMMRAHFGLPSVKSGNHPLFVRAFIHSSRKKLQKA